MCPFLLCIETSSTNCSVAIFQGDKNIALLEEHKIGYSHAENLHLFIDHALKSVGLKPQDIHGIAVSEGPGSYTGLRIGASAVKGLCFALQVPLIAVSTLQSIVQSVKSPKVDIIIPVIDARRMEIYYGIYDHHYKPVSVEKNMIVTTNSFDDFEHKTCTFIGIGVAKLKSVLSLPKATFIEHLPSAKDMGIIAIEKYEKKVFENTAYFAPNYIKPYHITQKTKK